MYEARLRVSWVELDTRVRVLLTPFCFCPLCFAQLERRPEEHTEMRLATQLDLDALAVKARASGAAVCVQREQLGLTRPATCRPGSARGGCMTGGGGEIEQAWH